MTYRKPFEKAEHFNEPAPPTYDERELADLGEPPYLPEPSTGYNPHRHREKLFEEARPGPLEDRMTFAHDVNAAHRIAEALRDRLGVAEAGRIGVYCEEGVVTLSGRADDAIRALAVALAAQDASVKRVEDRIEPLA